MGGWIGLRVVLLWPQIDSAADIVHAVAPVVAAAPSGAARPEKTQLVRATNGGGAKVASAPAALAGPRRSAPRRVADPTRLALALLGLVRYGDPQRDTDASPILPGLPRSVPATEPRPPRSRWSGSAWLVARGGSGIAPGIAGGQLGGAQAGVRLAYLLDRKHRVALAGRITTPLGTGLREAAVGVEWQPTRLPVRLVAEQRFALNGGRGGPGLAVVGGVGPVGLPVGFRLEAYGQAGAVRRAATDFYADGAVRIARPLASIGPARVDLGAGAWGAAQRGAARLDLGPSLGLVLPAGKRSLRIALDWRQRLAGDARPGSGPALTLGTDF